MEFENEPEKIEIKLKECCLTCKYIAPEGLYGMCVPLKREISCQHIPVCQRYKECKDSGAVEIPKHGSWVESEIPEEKFKCSVCGGGCWHYDYHGAITKSRFCPNCGAKMDLS